MKVLVTTEFYLPFRCGVTGAVEAEKKALGEKGDEVRVLTITECERSFYDASVSCWYVKATMKSFYKDSSASLNTRDPVLKEVLEWKPDIIHSQSEFFSFVFASYISRKLSVPIVHTCHTDFVSYTCHFTSHCRLWNFLASRFVPLFIRKAKRIICSTDKIYDLISSYGVKQPIDRIFIGIDLDLYAHPLPSDERRLLRERYGVSDNDILFLSVSRLSREKNSGETLSLFGKLRAREKRVKLLFVGDGEEREMLERRVRDEGLSDSVFFSGEIPHTDVWKYYRAGDICIGSSRSETQCLSYIEAMASELPVIVRYDSVLSSYLVSGVNGFSYNSENEFLTIASALTADGDRRREIGRRAFLDSRAFSLSIFAERLHDSFDKALKDDSRG